MSTFLSRSKKAVAGGCAAAAVALGTTLQPAIADGVFVWPDEFWPVATFTVGAFLVGFAGVWAAPANDTSP
ncbi:hypothetical protein [Microbacterium sp. 2FI]|uniref:hypothetical protein n=1 Tax=Microbacterium sp. 2FI TaxID=2502193 RepID=UPI0010F5B253|nr:hypothetical protein [Microbacterium sp. 2FI]